MQESPTSPLNLAFSLLCLLLLPIVISGIVIGFLPYRLYRRYFSRPDCVNFAIGILTVSLHLILSGVMKTLNWFWPVTVLEAFALRFYLRTSSMLAICAAVLYALSAPTLSLIVMAGAFLTAFLAYVSYRTGHRRMLRPKFRVSGSVQPPSTPKLRAKYLVATSATMVFVLVGYVAGGTGVVIQIMGIAVSAWLIFGSYAIGSLHAELILQGRLPEAYGRPLVER